MAEQDQHLKLRLTPGGVITATAFSYAAKFYDFAAAKLPELQEYAPDARGTLMQSAIIVSTLILLERLSPGNADTLHDNVSRSFAPPARHRCLTAIQDLSAELLMIDRAGIGPEAIPSFKRLGADDKTVIAQIGAWLARGITKTKGLDPVGQKIAATMGQSAWRSGIMLSKTIHHKVK